MSDQSPETPSDRGSTALPDFMIRQIRRLRHRDKKSIREIARIVGVAKVTVEKYVRIPSSESSTHGTRSPHDPPGPG